MADDTPKSCTGSSLPFYRLSLEKQKCLRKTGDVLRTPKDVAAFIQRHFGCQPVEHFIVLSCNSRSEVIGVHQVSVGGIGAAPVDPKVVFSQALLVGATSIILVHNHPSGDPEPSTDDVRLTQQIALAGGYLTIRVLDHIVIGRSGQHVSFQERGMMPR